MARLDFLQRGNVVPISRRHFLAVLVLACLLQQSYAQGGFLEKRGHRLFLNGQEFRAIGFNKVDLLQQYYIGGESKAVAKDIITKLGERGYRIIKIMVAPFFPAEIERVFFDVSKQVEDEKREKFFAAFDELLDDCDRAGLLVAGHMVWHMDNLADLGHHSLHEGVTNPQSEGYRKVKEISVLVADRYRSRATIGFWAIGSEWNLFADLQMPDGVLEGVEEGDFWHPGPLVRDARNNFNSQELADLFGRLAREIRRVDPNHLITTGTSEPRESAMHLFKAAVSRKEADWTKDDHLEQLQYVEMLHRDVDIISINNYGTSPMDLNLYQEFAERIGKPLVISELGLNSQAFEPNYNSEQGLQHLDQLLNDVVRANIPMTFIWRYTEKPDHSQLYYGVTDMALARIESANNFFQKKWPSRSR